MSLFIYNWKYHNTTKVCCTVRKALLLHKNTEYKVT